MIAAAMLFWFASADELYQRGVELFQAGKPDAAVEPLREAVRLAPRHAAAWKALGVAYAAQTDYAAAEQPFEQACRLEPRLVDACYYYGRNLYALNKFEPALAALEKALAVDPSSWRVHAGIAQAAEAVGSAAQAESAFQIAIRLFSASPADRRGRPEDDPRVHYGVFLFRQGKPEAAVEPLTQAVHDRPTSGKAHFELGRSLYQTGKLEEAAGHLSRAVELNHGQAAQLLLGKTLLRLGRREEAAKYLHAQ
jgi:Tfp pilus assembly protein PilF